MDTVDLPSRRTGIQWFDLSVGTVAILVSAVSLSVAFSENRTQQQLLAAAVWPSLQYTTNNINDQNEDEITFEIENAGVGPARIKTFNLTYNGQSIANSGDLIRRCCIAEALSIPGVSTQAKGRVLTPNKTIKFFALKKTSEDLSIWQKLNKERFQFRLRTCYCSVLDDCWELDTAQEALTKVEECSKPTEQQYQG